MDAKTIELWVKSLGRSYDTLASAGIIPAQPLLELYEGRDRVCIEPADGLELSFGAKSRRFETLFITLLKTTPSTVEYSGELPRPFMREMSQAGVRNTFGEPADSNGPVRMPKPMGLTGGWDAYQLDPTSYPNTKIIFKYTADFMVETLVFTLIDKGHE